MPRFGDMFHRSGKKDVTQDTIEAAAEKMSKKVQKETDDKEDQGRSTTYLKAFLFRDISDLQTVKSEVKAGNILILRITPLADKNLENVKKTVNELCEFVASFGGDIARLGSERIVVCPKNVKIWREKKPLASETITTT